MAPEWLSTLASKVFNIGLINQNANTYFENLCSRIIEDRRKDKSGGTDFLQTLADNYVEPAKGDSNVMVDEHGKLWTREGKM